jgi:hypothetical protein
LEGRDFPGNGNVLVNDVPAPDGAKRHTLAVGASHRQVPTGVVLDPGRRTTLDFDFEERTGRMCRPIRRWRRSGGSEFRQETSAKVAKVTKDAATLGGAKLQITPLKFVASALESPVRSLSTAGPGERETALREI